MGDGARAVTAELAALSRATAYPRLSPALPPTQDTAFLLREHGGGHGVHLDAAAPPAGLAQALRARRSARRFGGRPLTRGELGTLLGWGAGCGDGGGPQGAGGLVARRTYPSGGALYPVETHVVARAVDGLPPGVHRYQPAGDRLVARAVAPATEQLAAWLAPLDLAGVAALLVLTADWARPSLRRYGEKAFRLALLEAGHIGQAVALVGAALGLGVLPLCGFDDAALSRGCGLAYPRESVVYVLAIGAAP